MNGPDALRNYMADRAPAAPQTVSGMVELLGGGNARAGTSRLAEILSGSSDKSSKAYKSARRSVERYKVSEGHAAHGGKQGRANPANISKAVGAAENALIAKAGRSQPIVPSIGGNVAVGGDEEYEGYRDVYALDNEIDPAELDEFWDDIEGGDYDAAWDKLEDRVFDHYDLYPGDSYFTDIDSFDLGLDFGE